MTILRHSGGKEGRSACHSGQRRYVVRVAGCPADIAAAQNLRTQAFGLAHPDIDAFDAICTHFLIEDLRQRRLAGCFRLLPLASGADIPRSYAAQFYDLSALEQYRSPMSELGRFCIHPAARDPDILRAAWGAITAHVDANEVGMLFGCTSFRGADPAPHRGAFAALAAGYLAPQVWAPAPRAVVIVPLIPNEAPKEAGTLAHLLAHPLAHPLAGVPPLLRSYLSMGGWVSDHAVVDAAMNTLHVFTALEVAAIPDARKRLLRGALDGGGAAG